MAAITNNANFPNVVLRPACLSDATSLLVWRNDPQTRAESVNTTEVLLAEHEAWLRSVLENNNRRLYIAKVNGVPAGTVRADFHAEQHGYELSWTVAPLFRGQGVGKIMVKLLADQLVNSTVFARVKPNNRASASIAIYAGLQFVEEREGIHFYRRIPLG